MKRDKRAVSAIVATVLIIGITVGIIALVGNFLAGMVRDNLQGGTTCSEAALQVAIKTEGYTCYDALENELKVQVSNGPEDLAIQAIKVFPSYNGTDQDITTLTDTGLSPGLTKVLIIEDLDEKPDSVAIAPIILVGNSNKTCETSKYVTVLDC